MNAKEADYRVGKVYYSVLSSEIRMNFESNFWPSPYFPPYYFSLSMCLGFNRGFSKLLFLIHAEEEIPANMGALVWNGKIFLTSPCNRVLTECHS